MTIIEKLKEINEDDYFDPWYLKHSTKNWPKIEVNEDMEYLDLENIKFTEIGDNYLILKGGGDWQDPHEVRIELNSDNELEVIYCKPTNYREGDDINISKLLF